MLGRISFVKRMPTTIKSNRSESEAALALVILNWFRGRPKWEGK